MDAPTGPVLVVGYDGTPASTAALTTAADLAGRVGGSLQVVHADDTATLAAWAGPGAGAPLAAGAGLGTAAVVDAAALEQGLKERAGALEAEVRGVLGPAGPPWHFTARSGSPQEVLLGVADDVDAYAVVVGTPSTGPAAFVDHLLTGSVSRALERRAHRPVLVVPPRPDAPR